MRRPLLPLLLVTLALSACGKDDPNPYYGSGGGSGGGNVESDYGYWDTDLDSIDACDRDVIRSFKDVREFCDDDRQRGQRGQDCRSYSESFMRSYPDMRCRADGPNPRRPSPYVISPGNARWMMKKFYRRNDDHKGGFDGRHQNGGGRPYQSPYGEGSVGQIPAIGQQGPRGPNFPNQQNLPGYFQPQGGVNQNGLPQPYGQYPGQNFGPQGNQFFVPQTGGFNQNIR
ncbi:MAG: hypothetical protein EOP11_23390 [Proteobacteria bacterium]|nr:MAG: hypothetical protein EOP11_23390 [Pseudomonadota bacterium]